FSSRRRHTRFSRDWSSDVCSSDLCNLALLLVTKHGRSMFHSKIAGVGYYVPKNVYTNEDLTRFMDTSDEWIQERTGIQERRYARSEERRVGKEGRSRRAKEREI